LPKSSLKQQATPLSYSSPLIFSRRLSRGAIYFGVSHSLHARLYVRATTREMCQLYRRV
jgi:hypothetical protein